ncbi:MAG: GNAT family N-acetyltransferase [Deltaproteobacteria bacterium]|nr:GNAT family N-acetyltransferase [Deltaproteobacteria bacterium]
MSRSECIIVKKPTECSDAELERFVNLVCTGGEVAASGLEIRVRNAAKFLVFMTEEQHLMGVAALKQPLPNYRRSVSEKAGVALETSAFPYELGWVHVIPSARSRGFSHKLVSAAIAAVGGMGMFATSRMDNVRMHRTLERSGFVRSGLPYVSSRGNYKLQLFLRHTTQFGASV